MMNALKGTPPFRMRRRSVLNYVHDTYSISTICETILKGNPLFSRLSSISLAKSIIRNSILGQASFPI
ncbi:MAG: hypothetical protein G5Z42_04005 [Caldisphaeraceae archaeon]|nr:hypothetical protein [Caldisphaeraceae archaeon]MEB3692186.1 hypothetical protein [Caldisphaeraceae archaeon]MEB3797969.1 hypothetical protein [Caldisphaeraceae archaeon]